MGINGLPQNSPIENIKLSQTSNPKEIQGKTQINGRKFTIKQMDNSFSLNTLQTSEAFLSNTKELHQKREVHQKGIFHANYENTSGFGTVKQFFKNIKLLLQKNDMNALQETCLKRCSAYTDAYSMAFLSKDTIQQDALKKEISSVMEGLKQIEGNQKLNNEHPISKTLIALEALRKNFEQEKFSKVQVNKRIQEIIGEELKKPSQEQ